MTSADDRSEPRKPADGTEGKTSGQPTPHGDALGATAAQTGAVASPDPKAGDSPKRQGDELARAVDEAAGKR